MDICPNLGSRASLWGGAWGDPPPCGHGRYSLRPAYASKGAGRCRDYEFECLTVHAGYGMHFYAYPHSTTSPVDSETGDERRPLTWRYGVTNRSNLRSCAAVAAEIRTWLSTEWFCVFMWLRNTCSYLLLTVNLDFISQLTLANRWFWPLYVQPAKLEVCTYD